MSTSEKRVHELRTVARDGEELIGAAGGAVSYKAKGPRRERSRSYTAQVKSRSGAVVLAALVSVASTTALHAQPTAFTYQGRLTDSGAPASGLYALRFTLYDSSSGPAVVGRPLTNAPTAVSNGLFIVILDFGAGVFDGSARWLEIGVVTNGGGAFLTLAPRQPITTTPYAVRAVNAANAQSVSGTVPAGQLTGTVPLAQLPPGVVTNGSSGVNIAGTFSGNGSGLTSLNAGTLTGTVADARLSANVALLNGSPVFSPSLRVETPSGTIAFQGGGVPEMVLSGGQVPFQGFMRFRNALEIWPSQDASRSGSLDIRDTDSQPRISLPAVGNAVFNNGNVGIGTTNPVSALQVVGTVTATGFSGDGSGLTNLSLASVAVPPPGMVLIPTGTFTMGNSIGDPDISDANPISVTVSAFYMDVNLVSWSQWQSAYFWATAHGYGFVNAGAGKAANHPVQSVNWYDCVKWCNARSEQAGKTPVYYTDAGFTTVYRTGQDPVFANWAAKGYWLPTEAEWEKAARGGLGGQRFPWGNVINENLANYIGGTNSYDLGPKGFNAAYTNGGFPYTSPVGSFAANGYGLYDMAGNVFEWCWDWLGTPYAGGNDPHGPDSGLDRVGRGGSWENGGDFCRAAKRVQFLPGDPVLPLIGFREVLAPGQ